VSTLNYLTIAASILWWGSETAIGILKHSKPWQVGPDKLSYWVVWLSFLTSILAALGLAKVDKLGHFGPFAPFMGYAGCLVIALGVSIRWVAVATLGRQFTLQVTIIKDHRIIDQGIYKSIRHPAYLGSLISFIGLGFALENWISLLILLILPLVAILYRIKVEEKALLEHFGTQYEEYCKRTKKLLPKVY
jgi:protein-S-isoprenylcysteine O-methyltransferase Ste14